MRRVPIGLSFVRRPLSGTAPLRRLQQISKTFMVRGLHLKVDRHYAALQNSPTLAECFGSALHHLTVFDAHNLITHFRRRSGALGAPHGFPVLPPRLEVCELLNFGARRLTTGPHTNARLRVLSLASALSLVDLRISNLPRLESLCLKDSPRLATVSGLPTAAPRLTRLDLSYCTSLSALPTLPGRLQELVLSGCQGLWALPAAVTSLSELRVLDLYDCDNLAQLPDSLGQLAALTHLRLGYCTALEELPESIGALSNLHTLDAYGCRNLLLLPGSIDQLSNLAILELACCSGLVELPETLCKLERIKDLNLIGCTNLQGFPRSLEALPRRLNTLRLPAHLQNRFAKLVDTPFVY
jgi:hypothetical protein